jgi:peptidoglycan hydrolase-like protein with peptidoglycan-binding domain
MKRYFVPQYGILLFLGILSMFSFSSTYADTIRGNGYSVQQVITPFDGTVSGNSYTVQGAGQVVGGQNTAGGYIANPVFGTFVTTTTTPPVSSGGGGGGGSGWYYVMVNATPTSSVATGTPINPNTVLTNNGSSCATRILITQPIDTKISNNKEDIKKLETFLNTYEGEKLKVDGIYSKQDIAAVKRWQTKYKKEILTPMRLKSPTGTIYTSSMRQIEKQTTAACGQAVLVHSCPYFTTYVKYGDIGAEVKKVQLFLNIVQGERLAVNGKYGPGTRDAVLRFQRAHKKNIISFVTLSFISGNWNVSTRTKANEVIGCDKLQ